MDHEPIVVTDLAEQAYVAHHRHDWESVIRLSALLRAVAPDRMDGFLLGGEALRIQMRLDESDTVLREGMQRFPDVFWMTAYYCCNAGLRDDRDDEQRRWAMAVARFPLEVVPVVNEADVWLRMGRPDEALAILDHASQRGVAGPELIRKRLEISLSQAGLRGAGPDEQLDQIEAGEAECHMANRLIRELAMAKVAPEHFARPLSLLVREAAPGFTGISSLLAGWSDLVHTLGAQSDETAAARNGYAAFLSDPACPQTVATEQTRLALDPRLDADSFAALLGRCLRQHRTNQHFLVAFYPALPASLRKAALLRYASLGAAAMAATSWDGMTENEADEVAFCLIVAATVYAPTLRDDLLRPFRTRLKPAETPDLSTASGVLTTISRRAILPGDQPPVMTAVARPPSRRKRLRVALCVSGQLRGFRSVLPSWTNLGLGDHDVTTFVHVWRRIGSKLPGHRWDAQRCFSGRFLQAVIDDTAGDGFAGLWERFPSLRAELENGEGVEHTEVASRYQTPHVVVEDEQDLRFQSFDPAMKMYYKVWAAQEMAARHPSSFDLMIRIRPDKRIDAGGCVDWEVIAARSRDSRMVFTDLGHFVAEGFGLCVGDQVAAGAPEPMSAYAGAWKLIRQWHDRTPYAMPDRFYSHGGFAYAMLFEGIRAEPLEDVAFGELVNAERLPPDRIHELIRLDMAKRAPAKGDEQLLDAIRADAEAVG
jgi:hypothetical protein